MKFRGRGRHVLRQRDFRLLWTGETTSKLGSSVTAVVLPLLAVTTLGAGPFQVGLLNASAYLPWVLISLPAGAWVDRLRRRPIMLGCDVGSIVLLGSVPLAASLDVLTMTQLLVVAFFAGVASVLFVTAYRAYVPSVVAGADLVEANATLQGSEQVAQIAGRGMGGLLAQLFSPATAILADIATYVVSLMCLNGIRAREPVTRAHETPASLWSQIGDGLRFTVQDPYLRALSIFSAVGNLAYTGFLTLQIVFLVRDVGAEPSVIGVLVGTLSIGGLFGAMAAPRTSNRFGSARAMVLWAAMTAPFALLIPLTSNGPGLLLMVTGAVITGAGLVAITVIMISFRQTYCPPRLLGRVSASMQVANFAVVPLGTLASGALGSWLGSRTALWIDAALFLVYGCMLLAGPIRGLRDLPSAPVNEKASSFFR